MAKDIRSVAVLENLDELRSIGSSIVRGHYRVAYVIDVGFYVWRVGDQSANIPHPNWEAPSYDSSGLNGAWEGVKRFGGTDANALPTVDEVKHLSTDGNVEPEHATDAGTDQFEASLSADPSSGQVFTADFQSANTTTTPTFENTSGSLGALTIKTKNGSALWPEALNGVHELQYDGTDYLVLEPNDVLLAQSIRYVAPSRLGAFDTVADAYADLPSTGGKIVVLESTTETADINVTKPVHIQGAGGTSYRVNDRLVVLDFSGATLTTAGIKFDDSFIIENVVLLGPGSGAAGGYEGMRVGTSGASSGDRSVYRDIVVTGWPGHGIQIGPGQLSYIDGYRPYVYDCGGSGIRYFSSVASDFVTSCNIYGGQCEKVDKAFLVNGASGADMARNEIHLVAADNNNYHLYSDAPGFNDNYIIMPSWSPLTAALHLENSNNNDNHLHFLTENFTTDSTDAQLRGNRIFANGDLVNRTAFRAYKNSAQAIAGDGSTVTVVLDVEDFDNDGSFDLSTDTFNAPKAGIYQFNAAARFTDAAAGNYNARIFVNGSLVLGTTSVGTGTDPLTAQISTIQNLASGDTVTFRVVQSSGGSENIEGSKSSYFEGFEVR